jgi:hypothetical protein
MEWSIEQGQLQAKVKAKSEVRPRSLPRVSAATFPRITNSRLLCPPGIRTAVLLGEVMGVAIVACGR